MLRICIGFLRIFNLFMCFNVFIIIFYILRFSKKTPYIFYFLKTMIINTNLYCSIFTSFFHFCFYWFLIFVSNFRGFCNFSCFQIFSATFQTSPWPPPFFYYVCSYFSGKIKNCKIIEKSRKK